jgi:hypothetical protein
MPIPARFQLPPISPAEIREFCQLCSAIEDGVHRDHDEVDAMIARWNARACRSYEPVDFTKYYGAMDTEEFVHEALQPAPTYVPDVTYAELREVLEEVSTASIESQAEHSYFLTWLEVNLPDSNVSDLLYWPNEWFGNEGALDVPLDTDQTLRYLMLKSGRILVDAPLNVELSLPLPE